MKHPLDATLPIGQVHLWQTSLKQAGVPIDAFRALLSPNELERANRFRFQPDRQRFMLSRGGLRKLLGQYLDRAPERLIFRYNTFGKPLLEDAGDLDFNISHAGEVVVYAFARAAEIGVDIELIKPDFPVDDIAGDYFSPGEIAVYRALPEDARRRAFFACWTRKEAYIKAKREGLSIPLDSFDVTLAPGDPPRFLRIGDDPAEAERWSLIEFTPEPGYIGALAVSGRGWAVERFGLG